MSDEDTAAPPELRSFVLPAVTLEEVSHNEDGPNAWVVRPLGSAFMAGMVFAHACVDAKTLARLGLPPRYQAERSSPARGSAHFTSLVEAIWFVAGGVS